MRIDIVTLFPEMCENLLAESIIGRARARGHLQVCCHQLRRWGEGPHKRVDDCTFGGGKGMLLMAERTGLRGRRRTYRRAAAYSVYVPPWTRSGPGEGQNARRV